MNWIHTHAIEIIIIWYVFSAAVSALPSPLPNERWYQFVYIMLHGLAGSLARAGATLYPKAFQGANVQTDTVTVTKTTVDSQPPADVQK